MGQNRSEDLRSKILGGLLWISGRTRPDPSYSVSSAAQGLTKDIELLKAKLRHLVQYINTTQTLGLLYRDPRRRETTDFTVYSDASFARAGKHSQSTYTNHLSFGNTRHLIHWQSVRETKMSERSPRQNFTLEPLQG